MKSQPQTKHQITFILLVVLCVIFQLLDWHSTWLYFGEKSESNVAILWLESKIGLLWTLVIFKCVALMAVVGYAQWRSARVTPVDVWVFVVVNFFYSVIVTRNYIS